MTNQTRFNVFAGTDDTHIAEIELLKRQLSTDIELDLIFHKQFIMCICAGVELKCIAQGILSASLNLDVCYIVIIVQCNRSSTLLEFWKSHAL